MKKRPSARVILLNDLGQVYLFHFKFTQPNGVRSEFWATPGGAIESGETPAKAAERELSEETGLSRQFDASIHIQTVEFALPNGDLVLAEEHFFRTHIGTDEIHFGDHTALEREIMQTGRWFGLNDIANEPLPVFPEALLDLIK
jgi:8-oxo-dGTP pyrophosphatase MutT (NUDIX family)